jgi:hypothetical protein
MSPINSLNAIKIMLYAKKISYDEAKKQAQPFIDAINEKSKEIAKKYKVKAKLINFSGFMR